MLTASAKSEAVTVERFELKEARDKYTNRKWNRDVREIQREWPALGLGFSQNGVCVASGPRSNGRAPGKTRIERLDEDSTQFLQVSIRILLSEVLCFIFFRTFSSSALYEHHA